jgi:hypothetical protein
LNALKKKVGGSRRGRSGIDTEKRCTPPNCHHEATCSSVCQLAVEGVRGPHSDPNKAWPCAYSCVVPGRFHPSNTTSFPVSACDKLSLGSKSRGCERFSGQRRLRFAALEVGEEKCRGRSPGVREALQTQVLSRPTSRSSPTISNLEQNDG